MIDAKIVDVWFVWNHSMNPYVYNDQIYYTDENKAKIAAKGKGNNNDDATIIKQRVVITGDRAYLLGLEIDVDERIKKREESIMETVKSKLTAEEYKVMQKRITPSWNGHGGV